ncbi:MAG TPA: hypothetical protein VFU59_06030 [Candidatus Eisenbacteria bacterium]|nr:hypothetical protein [Candidatus Eisenbacteria bacterium]
MRPAPILRAIPAILFALLVLGAWGCSKDDNRLLGNERLARGPDGLGTTTSDVYSPDRDTYLRPGDPNFGSVLLVGSDGTFESRAFFKPTAWTLPDTTDVTLQIDTVRFEISFSSLVSIPGNLTLNLVRATDTLSVNPGPTPELFPGPATGTSFGTGNTNQAAPFTVQMPATTFDSMKTWAKYPSAFRGFVLLPIGAGGVVGFTAGTASVSVVSTSTKSGSPVRSTVKTTIPLDYTIHSTATPLATGSDAILRLGGRYEWGVPLRFSPPVVPEGSTVNEATLLLRVDPSMPFYPLADTVIVEVRGLPKPWTEATTDTLLLGAETTVIARRTGVRRTSAADSVIAIGLPQTLIRKWTSGGVNEGVFVTIKDAYLHPEFLLDSRESANSIVLRVSTTSPPPGRF